ncbi:uncharacterized protein RIC-3 isoform X2 [Halyomorpha halys]|uniref:uncharacterized protein RIC-3 isoform X2 n=1 Tax=Halyomorpha halys TaxID=286706 RepID=UPI0034D25825
MASDFSTGKSIFVLAIVAGCFAILWPNVFYPMIQGSYSQKDTLSTAQGCCDVMFDSDVNAIKVMIEICEKILLRQADFDSKLIFAFQQGKLTKDIVNQCQKTVFESCGVDITQFLMDKVRLGRNYKQMLDEIRSHNSSLCLKQSFGASLGKIGLPRRIRVWGMNGPKHLKQERPPHLRPEFLHPALREKGRAIPHTHIVPKVNIQEGRTIPMPGIRPPMGGPGQVVPPPKTTSGTMGVVMPMYTIGIIVFFLYTMMKESETLDQSCVKSLPPDGPTCDDEIKETEKSDEGKSVVKVLGMEMTESCEHGGKWSRPPTPLSRPSTPQNIFISGSLPSKSQLLVSDSLIETVPAQDDGVVLTGKVTLSLIGYSENKWV